MSQSNNFDGFSFLSFHFAGLSSSSADAKSELMMRKNVFLLTPNLPTSADSNAVLQTSTMLDNSSDDKQQLIPNYQIDHHNSATSDNINHNLVMIGDNDENYFELFRTPMRFGTENHTVITTQIGATAHIPCTIHHIGEGVVSAFWEFPINLFAFKICGLWNVFFRKCN